MVAADEPISRFIVHTKGYFSAENRRVKRRAFMPDPTDNETSCYRTQRLRTSQIGKLCRKHVTDRFHGRAEIIAREIITLVCFNSARQQPAKTRNDHKLVRATKRSGYHGHRSWPIKRRYICQTTEDGFYFWRFSLWDKQWTGTSKGLVLLGLAYTACSGRWTEPYELARGRISGHESRTF